jgi:hypothetical protein
MNRGLIWGLAGTAALSTWVLLNPRLPRTAPVYNAVVQPALPVAAVDARTTAFATSGKARADFIPETSPAQADRWPEPTMEPANRSPFESPVLPPPKPIAPAPGAPVTRAPEPPPPANYRFWGHMAAPDKRVMFFLALGQDGAPIQVQQGTHLDGGWSVESISDNAVVLANDVTQQRTTIFVPAAETTALH